MTTPKPDDDAPTSYFEMQRRRMGLDGVDDAEINEAIPKLPATSPWSSDPCGPEPLIDRSEDANAGIKQKE
jgi:hypothetical protein